MSLTGMAPPKKPPMQGLAAALGKAAPSATSPNGMATILGQDPMDLSQTGDYENWHARNRGAFAQPGAEEQNWVAQQGQLNTMQAQPGVNVGQQNMQGFSSSLGMAQQWAPKPAAALSFRPQAMNLDPYYNRQWSKVSTDVNNAYGARGMFNSSAALEGLQDARVGLAAEQANREADYGLKLAQYGLDEGAQGLEREKLGAEYGLQLGQLGVQEQTERRQGAELASTEQFKNRDHALRLLEERRVGAQGAQLAHQNRLVGGGNAARMSQDAREGRVQTAFDNIYRPAEALSNYVGAGLNNMQDQDERLREQEAQLMMSIPRERYNQSAAQDERLLGGLGTAWNAVNALRPIGGGGRGRTQSPYAPSYRPEIADPWGYY